MNTPPPDDGFGKAPEELSPATRNRLKTIFDRLGALERGDDRSEQVALCREGLSYFPPGRNDLLAAIFHAQLAKHLIEHRIGARADNLAAAIAAGEEALRILAECDREGESIMATVHEDLAMALESRGQEGDLDRSAHHYRKAIGARTGDTHQTEWAIDHWHLADLLLRRGDVEGAITHGLDALKVLNPEGALDMWARVTTLVGLAYLRRRAGQREQNLNEAVARFTAVVGRVETEGSEAWAIAQHNLASTFMVDERLTDQQRIERIIAHNEPALRCSVFAAQVRYGYPAHRMLALAYKEREAGDLAENFARAAQNFTAAIALLPRQPNPVEWAMIRLNAALLHLSRASLEPGHAELAIGYLTQALEVAPNLSDRKLVAVFNDQLGKAYLSRAEGDRADNVERAIASFERASAEMRPAGATQDWASVEAELSTTYATRLKGDPNQNIEIAIDHANKALTVFTTQAAPRPWAGLSLQLAELFFARVLGPREENLNAAGTHARNALTVIERAEAPFDWARCHAVLGSVHLLCESGSPKKNEDEALAHFTETLGIVTPDSDSENWALMQMNVGLVHYRRSRRERAGHVDKAIECYRAALGVAERGASPLLQGQVHANLATALSDRTDGNRRENEDTAAEHFERATELLSRTKVPREWARLKYNQGRFLVHRGSGDKASNIERAITVLKEALEIRTRETSAREWALTQDTLGNAYAARIRGTLRENRAEAIAHYSRALEVLTAVSEPYHWALATSNLAIIYKSRDEDDAAENQQTAIQLNESALTVFTPDTYPVEYARVCANLGAAYSDRLRGNAAANVEASINYCRNALAVYDRLKYPSEWASVQNVLGGSYLKRISGDAVDNVKRAIEHLQQALTVRTEQDFPQDWAMTLSNLAGALLRRLDGDPDHNREIAIDYLTKAVRVLGPDAPIGLRAGALVNLAAALTAVRRADAAASRRRAVATLEEAAAIAPRAQLPDLWAQIQVAMGIAQFELVDGNRVDNISAAITCNERALWVYDRRGHPLQWADAQRNIGAFRIARNDPAQRDVELGIDHMRAALTVLTRETQPVEYRRTHLMLGDVHFRHDDYAAAEESFDEAAAAGALLLASAYTETGRRAEVATAPDLFAASALSLIRLGRSAEALARLEQGKTRLLNQALALENLDLGMLAQPTQSNLQSLRQEIHELESEMRLPTNTPARRTDRDLADALGRARAELAELVKLIRAQQPDFMPDGLNIAALLRLVPAGGAIVAPLFTSKGSAAFVLPHGHTSVTGDDIVMLDGLTDADLHNLLYGADTTRLGGWLGAYADRRADFPAWLRAIETTGQVLWDRFVAPIDQRLQSLGLKQGAPVLLLPQGGLGILPLHVAWRSVGGHKRYFLDDWTPSYSPSGFALDASRRRLCGAAPRADSLLAVIDPTGDLQFAPTEGRAVLELFPANARKSLHESEATSEAVTTSTPGRRYVHFACHGIYDWLQPMQSSLLLASGERLTLADIVGRLDLSTARLVALSACETGLTDVRVSPDEYLGLPTAFLRRGTPGVLSSLWAVNDFSTMLLMQRFYRAHLRDGLDPASALRAAQRWLRDATNAELADVLAHRRAPVRTGSEAAFEQILQAFARQAGAAANKQPFAHPYHWAAFTMSGC